MKLILNIDKTALFFILLGVFFLPFNSFEGISFLGEFSRDSCVLFFLTAGFLLLFKKKISIPVKSPFFQIFLIFFVWCFLSVLLNSNDLLSYHFKGISGVERFIRQAFSLILATIVMIVIFYNVFKNYELEQVFFKIRKTIMYSLIIVSIYAFLEFFIVYFNAQGLLSVLNIFEYFPFTSVNIDRYTNRISSVTFEAPALATYIISISGWMFSYVLTEKGIKRFFPAFFTIILAFLSGSRAGFFVILLQIIVFILYIIKDKKFNKLFVDIFAIFILTGAIATLSFGKTIVNYIAAEFNSFKTDDDIHALSNKSRFGIQYAMYSVFLENPLIGTGYGLQAFESKDKYPSWATEGNWEFRVKYLNEEDPRFPPGYNFYLRLLSETGIIGFLIFILFIISVCMWCFNKTFTKQGSQTIIPLVLTISIVGFVFNWLKMDTLRIYFFWICLTFIIIYNLQPKALSNEE